MFNTDPFYLSPRWKRLRAQILRRDGYRCRIAARYGIARQADTVHHIFPRNKFPQYEWEPWNLISVSRKAHMMLHDRNNNELTAEGRALLFRTAAARGITIPPAQGSGL